jgi:glutathione peroxidase
MIKNISLVAMMAFSFVVSIYSFQLNGINGSPIKMSNYQGKKILLVNTASTSIYTSQYTALEQLHQKFKDSGLVIIACPSNSFGHEAASDSVIKNFITQNYNAHFVISKKIHVKGANAAPIYKWLADAAQNGVMSDTIKNDFCKVLIDTSGNIMAAFSSSVSPMSAVVQGAVRN